jgi:hypothetical protein
MGRICIQLVITNRLLPKRHENAGPPSRCRRSDFLCVEDSSTVHRKKDTRRSKGLCNKARAECVIYSTDWPPKSPDLNPIGNLWRVIMQKLRNRRRRRWNLGDLKDAVFDIWEKEITSEIYNKWIDEMPECLQGCT